MHEQPKVVKEHRIPVAYTNHLLLNSRVNRFYHNMDACKATGTLANAIAQAFMYVNSCLPSSVPLVQIWS